MAYEQQYQRSASRAGLIPRMPYGAVPFLAQEMMQPEYTPLDYVMGPATYIGGGIGGIGMGGQMRHGVHAISRWNTPEWRAARGYFHGASLNTAHANSKYAKWATFQRFRNPASPYYKAPGVIFGKKPLSTAVMGNYYDALKPVTAGPRGTAFRPPGSIPRANRFSVANRAVTSGMRGILGFGVLDFGLRTYMGISSGQDAGKTVLKSGLGAIGTTLGWEAGMLLGTFVGGAVGTALGPGFGTAVGMALGATLGLAGDIAGETAGDIAASLADIGEREKKVFRYLGEGIRDNPYNATLREQSIMMAARHGLNARFEMGSEAAIFHRRY